MSIKLARKIAHVMVALFFVGAALFCIYGFMATFEPLEPSLQFKWRFIYKTIEIACWVGAVLFVQAARRQL